MRQRSDQQAIFSWKKWNVTPPTCCLLFCFAVIKRYGWIWLFYILPFTTAPVYQLKPVGQGMGIRVGSARHKKNQLERVVFVDAFLWVSVFISLNCITFPSFISCFPQVMNVAAALLLHCLVHCLYMDIFAYQKLLGLTLIRNDTFKPHDQRNQSLTF